MGRVLELVRISAVEDAKQLVCILVNEAVGGSANDPHQVATAIVHAPEHV